MPMPIRSRFDLTGRAALVTGGARGIGAACAEGLAEFGANVAIADVLRDALEGTAQDLASRYPVQVGWLTCDVTNRGVVEETVSEVVRLFGRLDILVNSVGICVWEDAESMTEEQWRSIIETNLTGAFYQSQAAGRRMIEQGGGSIIHIASMSGSIVNTPQSQVAYNTSKAGLIHMARSLAVEWAPHGVRVNTISPGYTLTEMTRTVAEHHEGWKRLIPMGRMAEPEELVGAVVYLASEAASYTTGHDLVIDGGYTLL
jgi:sorbose reductase